MAIFFNTYSCLSIKDLTLYITPNAPLPNSDKIWKSYKLSPTESPSAGGLGVEDFLEFYGFPSFRGGI